MGEVMIIETKEEFNRIHNEITTHNNKKNIKYYKVLCRLCMCINKINLTYVDEINYCLDCDYILGGK